MTDTPISLTQTLAAFSDVYSPRIVGRVNDYDVRVAHARGEHVWHVHDHTDEFFLVIDGQFDIALRGGDGERTVTCARGTFSWCRRASSTSRRRPAARS